MSSGNKPALQNHGQRWASRHCPDWLVNGFYLLFWLGVAGLVGLWWS